MNGELFPEMQMGTTACWGGRKTRQTSGDDIVLLLLQARICEVKCFTSVCDSTAALE